MPLPGRGIGVGAVLNRESDRRDGAALGADLATQRAKHVQEQLALFKTHLEGFAAKHRHDINRDPEFRRQFTKMAKSIGVDPLASSKGFWGELLGLGDYYYELSVQIVDICLARRAVNGGLMPLQELRARLQAARPRNAEPVSEDDVKQSLRKLATLGGGYSIVKVGGTRFVLSVPAELSSDTVTVLQHCDASVGVGAGFVTIGNLVSELHWTADRATAACSALVRDGFAWVDDGAPDGVRRYYAPAVWRGSAA